MHIREIKSADFEPPSHWTHKGVPQYSNGQPPRWADTHLWDVIRLGDVVIMHSRGRWGTALVTKIGRKNLTASYVTEGGIASSTVPNVTNKSVPIGECYRGETGRIWQNWHVPTDDDLPEPVRVRLGSSHELASGSPNPGKYQDPFTSGDFEDFRRRVTEPVLEKVWREISG